jgi:hypothetical protein
MEAAREYGRLVINGSRPSRRYSGRECSTGSLRVGGRPKSGNFSGLTLRFIANLMPPVRDRGLRLRGSARPCLGWVFTNR